MLDAAEGVSIYDVAERLEVNPRIPSATFRRSGAPASRSTKSSPTILTSLRDLMARLLKDRRRMKETARRGG
jgi:hypothetical protein